MAEPAVPNPQAPAPEEPATQAPTPSLRVALLLDEEQPAASFAEAARSDAIELHASTDPTELLAHLRGQPCDVLLLPIGARQEEALLCARAVRRRDRRLALFFVDRGGDLIESDDEARLAGGWGLLDDDPPAALFARVRDRLREFGSPTDLAAPLALRAPRRGLSLELALRKLDQARFADYFVLLELSRDATTAQITAAYQRWLVVLEAPCDGLAEGERDELLSALDDASFVLLRHHREHLRSLPA